MYCKIKGEDKIMKKLLLSIILGFVLFTAISTSVSISAQDGETETVVIEEDEYEVEFQNMRDIFNSHYEIECGSKKSRKQFKTNNDLREIYDEMCKRENDDKDIELEEEGLYINPNIHLVESFID